MITNRRHFLTGAAALSGLSLLPGAHAQSERFSALALQMRCDAVNQDTGRASARARMMASIGRMRAQIASSKAFLRTFNGTELKLAVVPEYFMTGFPLGESRAEWRDKAAIDVDGPEYEAMAAIAQSQNLYLCVNAYETDVNFPELYFQANVIFAPNGEQILRYRRMISLYTPSPFDVWDQYLDIYGYDAVFPVARTAVGVLATIASEEILYPEIARMHAMKGAEIFLHPTSEVGSTELTPKHIAKRARAVENMAYVISANSAEIVGTPIPSASTDAMSQIVDWNGRILAEAQSGESLNANTILDLDGLRGARARTGMTNLMSRQPWAAYAPAYEAAQGAEPNALAEGAIDDRAAALARQRQVIERLQGLGER